MSEELEVEIFFSEGLSINITEGYNVDYGLEINLKNDICLKTIIK